MYTRSSIPTTKLSSEIYCIMYCTSPFVVRSNAFVPTYRYIFFTPWRRWVEKTLPRPVFQAEIRVSNFQGFACILLCICAPSPGGGKKNVSAHTREVFSGIRELDSTSRVGAWYPYLPTAFLPRPTGRRPCMEPKIHPSRYEWGMYAYVSILVVKYAYANIHVAGMVIDCEYSCTRTVSLSRCFSLGIRVQVHKLVWRFTFP